MAIPGDYEPFIRSAVIAPSAPGETSRDIYPWNVPAVAALDGLSFDSPITYFVGENGSGKSTIIEALAVAAGLNAEGGSRNFLHSTRDSHSDLWQHLRLARGARRPKTDFFLRAESFFTVASYVEALPRDGGDPLAPYGGRSLHEQSHGESFLALLIHRFGPEGLYFLDEPEAALSPQGCLTCLRRVHELVHDGSQLFIATHSPVVLAYPGARIYECSGEGLQRIPYEDAACVALTRTFLDSRERFVERLLSE